MLNTGASLTLRACTFERNYAGDGAGVYHVGAAGTLSDCIFMENNASAGGGTYIGGVSPRIESCTFVNNTGGWSEDAGGGGVYNVDAAPSFTDCVFQGNEASRGAGMYNERSSPALGACVFQENGKSTHDGGAGIYNHDSSPTATNCIFTRNEALAGAAVFNVDSSAVFLHCTFAWNTATSHAGVTEGGGPAIQFTNCIFWGNSPDEIREGAAGRPIVRYSLVRGGCPGEGNVDANPLFLDMEGGDFRLNVSSPCLDSGTPDGAPATDFDGVARPQGSGIDMGAYEMPLATLAAMDTDNDGMTDTWEALHGVDDPEGDPDHDTMTNFEEYLAAMDPNVPYGAVWYVDAGNTADQQDGRTWATAFVFIQDAVGMAARGGAGSVWVAEGQYVGAVESPGEGEGEGEGESGEPAPVLAMKEEVHVYGGFAGDGPIPTPATGHSMRRLSTAKICAAASPVQTIPSWTDSPSRAVIPPVAAAACTTDGARRW